MSDFAELRKLQDIIDNQADDILDREGLLLAAGKRLSDVDTAMVDAMALIKAQAARIEQLEAVLRGIANKTKLDVAAAVEMRAAARETLVRARQENDDVFPGFRGNNEA